MIKKSQAWLDRQPLWIQVIAIVMLVFIIRTFGFGLYQVPTGSMETTMLVGERFFADKLSVWFTSIRRGEIIAFNEPTYTYSNNYFVNLWERYVWGPTNWTKRVIGIPGDHVVGTIEDGKPVVYVNDKKLDEQYLNKYPLVAAFDQMPNKQSRKLFSDERVMRFSFDPALPWSQWSQQPFYGKALQPAQLILNDPRYPIAEPGTPYPHPQVQTDIFDVTLGENQYWVMGDNRLGSWDSRGWGILDGTLIHGRIKFCIFSLDSLDGWWIADLIRHPIAFWSKVRWDRCCKFVS